MAQAIPDATGLIVFVPLFKMLNKVIFTTYFFQKDIIISCKFTKKYIVVWHKKCMAVILLVEHLYSVGDASISQFRSIFIEIIMMLFDAGT